MIDSNAIFDAEGVARLGIDDDKYLLTLTRRDDGVYNLTIDDQNGNLMVYRLASQDDVYNLGTALARLADVL